MKNENNIKWGIDLGGTKIEAVILDAQANNKILFRERVPTLSDQGYKKVLSQIEFLVNLMKEKSQLSPTEIGMGTPGRLDPASQTLKNSNSVCLNDQPVLKDLENLLQVKVKIENDANCFALSEAVYLLNNGYEDGEVILGIILGTGVGGGIVAHGKLISGRHGLGGEWGHNFLDESGGECYCGKIGCVEKIIAGPSLEQYYYALSSENLKLKDIVEKSRAESNENITLTMDRLFYFFGKAMAQVINILDPTIVVIGGGVGNIDELYTHGTKHIKKYLFNNELHTQFLKPKFGDSSGVLGAALL